METSVIESGPVTAIDPPRKLLVFFLILALGFSLICSVRSETTSFDFPSFSLRNFTLLGDSYLRSGVVGLTRELGVPSSSSGTVVYNRPVPSLPGASFSFCIDNVNPTSLGDGLTFFLSPDNDTLGSPGGYLGLVNSSQLTKNRFVAVEFDTRLDLHFEDPNGNHVGLDVDSLNSIKTADAMSAGIDLKSGNSVTAWIDYKNTAKEFSVFLSYSSLKPETPILTVAFDLCGFFLDEVMYLGFSASTEGRLTDP